MLKTFDKYPESSYDCQRGMAEELCRMCDFFAWGKGDDEAKKFVARSETPWSFNLTAFMASTLQISITGTSYV